MILDIFQQVKKEGYLKEYREYYNGSDSIVDYFLSFNGINEGRVVLKEAKIDEFRRFIHKKLESEGKILVSKDTGIFICRK